jgi:hypothetical protein
MAVSTLLYRYENLTLNKKRDTRMYTVEMKYFNSVSGYKIHDDKTNTKTGGLNK